MSEPNDRGTLPGGGARQRLTDGTEVGRIAGQGSAPSGRSDVPVHGGPHAALDELLIDGPVVVFITEVPGSGSEPSSSSGYLSPSIEPVFGYQRHEVQGPDFWLSCVHPDDREMVVATRERAVATNTWPTEIEYRFRHADGSYRWVESIVNLRPGHDGRPDRLVGIVQDVTERHHAEAQLRERARQMAAMFDGAPAQIYAKDLEGRYLLANRNVLELWGLEQSDVIGRTDHDLWPEFADTYAANDREVAAGGVPVITDEVADVDGVLRTYLSLKFPLRDDHGEIYATAGVSTDITDREQTVRALRDAKEAADRSNLAKSEFLSRMSHELRTPLNAVIGFAQLLGMSDLSETDRESVRQILGAGRHLLDLINEVLDIARIEAGRLTVSIEPVGLRDLVDEAVALVTPAAHGRSITITVDDRGAAGAVASDRQRLLQVMLNLLSNAIKYNRDEGRVTVTLAPGAPGFTRVAVRDTGRGIPVEQHERVFEAFERLDAEASAIEGAGVGLALSKHLIERMGGTIGVESAPGEGSEFCIEVPVADVAPVSSATEPSSGPGAAGGSTLEVLHIEDNLTNLALIEALLASRPSIDLHSTRYGMEGLAYAREHQPGLILLDLHLPDLPGIEVLHRLQAEPSTASIPVVVVSADATPRQRRRLIDSGAVAYLPKPLDLNELLELVEGMAQGGGAPPKAGGDHT